MAGSYKAEAIVLRSLRFGEADRVLHLYSREAGRIGAVAKGVRKTRSRFGARLEPMTRVALVLHAGRGELHTISAAEIVESHRAVREDPYRLAVGLVGLESVSRLFAEGEPAPRAYLALSRFLEALAERPVAAGAVPAREPALLALQLKLHWVAGFAPTLDACAACGAATAPVRFSAPAGGGVCEACPGGFPFDADAFATVASLLERPIAEAPLLPSGLADAIARAIADLNAEHGGFRLRTLGAAAVAV